MRHTLAYISIISVLAPTFANAVDPAPNCREPSPIRGNFNPAKPVIGILIKDSVVDPEASVRRIVKVYHLKLDEAAIRDIIGNRFFSNYFAYENPTPELVSALRCDSDVSAIYYDGIL